MGIRGGGSAVGFSPKNARRGGSLRREGGGGRAGGCPGNFGVWGAARPLYREKKRPLFDESAFNVRKCLGCETREVGSGGRIVLLPGAFWAHGASKMAILGASLLLCILHCFGASEGMLPPGACRSSRASARRIVSCRGLCVSSLCSQIPLAPAPTFGAFRSNRESAKRIQASGVKAIKSLLHGAKHCLGCFTPCERGFARCERLLGLSAQS